MATAVEDHLFSSGLEHFRLFGGRELRAPNELFVPSEYLELNADVAAAFELGAIKHPFLHINNLVKVKTVHRLLSFGFDVNSISLNEDVAAVLPAHLYQLYTTTSRLVKGNLGMVRVLEG